MKKNGRIRSTFVLRLAALVLAMSGITGASGSGQRLADSKPASLNQVIDIHLTNATLMLALSELAAEHRVPIGFEQAMGSRQNPNEKIHVKRGTLKSILDSLVSQEPRYKWELRDGVINVTPVVGRDEFLALLLETKIAQFVPPKGTTDKFQLRDAILSLPEVKQLLHTNNVAVRPYDYAYGRSIYSNDGVDLTISNTDVRAVLNHVAKETEHKIWFVGEGRQRKRTAGYLLTGTARRRS
jgi:hypothetical protein